MVSSQQAARHVVEMNQRSSVFQRESAHNLKRRLL
jgi:hypothetical protein